MSLSSIYELKLAILYELKLNSLNLSMAAPRSLGLSQIMSGYLRSFYPLRLLYPTSWEGSSPNPVLPSVDDLEAANPPITGGTWWQWITSYTQRRPRPQIPIGVPRADQTAMPRAYLNLLGPRIHLSLGNTLAVIAPFWSRSGDNSPGLPVIHRSQLPDGPKPHHPPFLLDKTVVAITFPSVVSVTFVGQQPEPNHHLHLFGMVMLFAFACSFCGSLLRHACTGPRAARILHKMAYFFIAVGYYRMISELLQDNFIWVCWLVGALSLVSFALALKAEEWDP